MPFTKKSQYHDNTEISTYKECPRKYFIRHVLGWTVSMGNDETGNVDKRKAPALVFGSCWHAGMDAVWGAGLNATPEERLELAIDAFKKEWEENNYEYNLSLDEAAALGARNPGVASEMYYNYIDQRGRMLAETNVLGIEQPIAMPFPGLDDTWYVGKLDKVVDYHGIHILEHKTTTLYRINGNFDADYIESWNAASQVKGYQMVGSLYYPDLQDVWVDCSLVHKKVHDAFRFVPVSHSWHLLEEWITDTRKWISCMTEERQQWEKNGRVLKDGNFRRNEDQCYGKYGKCPFLAICSTISDPSILKEPPVGYVEERWEPFDVLKLEKLIEQGDK